MKSESFIRQLIKSANPVLAAAFVAITVIPSASLRAQTPASSQNTPASTQVKKDTGGPKKDTVKAIDDRLMVSEVKAYPVMHRSFPGFGDRLEIHVKNPAKLLAAKSDVVLYIDNYCLRHIKGQRVSDTIYNFTLTNVEDTAFWTNMFLTAKKFKGKPPVTVAVGTVDGTVLSLGKTQQIDIYNQTGINITWGVFGILTILIIIVGNRSNLLRETCDCECSETVKKKRRPYSLARTQMAFWTTIVSFAILYIYFGTGSMPDVSNTTLVLLGISASTTVFGYLIDNNVAGNVRTPGQEGDTCCSLGFFRDIVSDNGVPGIHRFQNIIFTLLLGSIYFYKVSHNLQMTEFNSNLLLLMGISSGAYVGVKFIVSQPSNQAPAANPPAKDPIV